MRDARGFPLPDFEFAVGDPNDCSPHQDTIKEKLRAVSNDSNASEELRRQALEMLAMFYPETPPADSNRWQGQGNVTGGIISNGKRSETNCGGKVR